MSVEHLVRIAWKTPVQLFMGAWASPLVVACKTEDEARKAICAAAALGPIASITVEETETVPFAEWLKRVREDQEAR